MKFLSLFSGLALAALVSGTPQPQVTPVARAEATSLYDTGLNAGAANIYLTKDLIGELKSAGQAGQDVQSLASETASAAVVVGLGAIRPFTSLNSEATASISSQVYSLYSEAASIATISDPASFSSAGAQFTDSLVDSLSEALASATPGSGGPSGSDQSSESDASIQLSVPTVLSLTFTFMAFSGSWFVL